MLGDQIKINLDPFCLFFKVYLNTSNLHNALKPTNLIKSRILKKLNDLK